MSRWGPMHCYPMEKYHNDIGNRLSELYMPKPSTRYADEHLPKEFFMLTIDTRHLKSSRQRAKMPLVTMSSRNEVHPGITEDAVPDLSTSVTCSPSRSKSSETSIARSTTSEQANLQQRKMRFKDKLTRALFQKKHLCCRCKRRSRSCIPNKTFNGIEKRYTCCKCQEASDAVKNLFDRQSNSKDSEHSNSSLADLLAPQSKKYKTQIPVPQHKDSGYETVTSCSTVASESSAFTTSANTNLSINKVAVKCAPKDKTDLNSKRDIIVPKINKPVVPKINEPVVPKIIEPIVPKINEPIRKFEPIIHKPCAISNSFNPAVDMVKNTTELCPFLAASQQDAPVGVLRQINQRNVKDYDGYLPDFYRPDVSDQKETCQALVDAASLEGSTENHCSYLSSRIIKINKDGRKVTSASKACYTCDSTSKVFFRLAWEGGWICEDCLDRLH